MEDYYNRIKVIGTGSNVKVTYGEDTEDNTTLNTALKDIQNQFLKIKSEIGSRYVQNKEKGISNGVATLDSNGKVFNSQLPDGAETFVGTWDPSEGWPSEKFCVPGYYFRVSKTGSIDGVSFEPGDKLICEEYEEVVESDEEETENEVILRKKWSKIPNGESVTSVNGQTGKVFLNSIKTSSDDSVAFGELKVSDENAYMEVMDEDYNTSRLDVISEKIEEKSGKNKRIVTPSIIKDEAYQDDEITAEIELEGKKGTIKLKSKDLISILASEIKIETDSFKVNGVAPVTKIFGLSGNSSGNFDPTEISIKEKTAPFTGAFIGIGVPSPEIAGGFTTTSKGKRSVKGAYFGLGGDTSSFNEPSGILFTSDHIEMWTPADESTIQVYDEDSGNKLAEMNGEGYWDKSLSANTDSSGNKFETSYVRYVSFERTSLDNVLKALKSSFANYPCDFYFYKNAGSEPYVTFEGANKSFGTGAITGEWRPLPGEDKGILKLYSFKSDFFFIFYVEAGVIKEKRFFEKNKEYLVTGTEDSSGNLNFNMKKVN